MRKQVSITLSSFRKTPTTRHHIQTRYAQKLWIEDLLKDVVYLPFE